MTAAAVWFALALSALDGSADVSLVQVVQTQTGGDGRLAKSLVDVARGRMRLVSAVAKKAGDGPDETERPWRVVEVLELATTSVMLLDPESRTWERRGLDRFVDGPPTARLPKRFDIVASSVQITPGAFIRRCLGADCSHYHALATITLRDREGRRSRARLEQDIWMAPLTGEAQKGLLDLIAFEAEFRRQTGSALSPIDRQTYRLGEAAEHLGVSRAELERVVAKVRRALSDVPGYPLVSAVAWWSDRPARKAPAPKADPKAEPKLLQDPPAPPPPPPRRPFVRIDWHGGWKRLDRALAGAQAGLPGPARVAAPAQPPVLERYEAFRAELAAIVEQLDRTRAPAEPRAGAAELERENGALTPAPPTGAGEAGSSGSRLYEAFSEIGELVFIGGLPEERFRPPAGFKRR